MQPGDVFLGKFRIERVLGSGGMGFVVAARHVELDELFAVKLMHPEALSNPEAIKRFIREARSAARLKGEHVARVHDVGRLDSGAPYMMMEHLIGDDLSQLLDKRGALPVHEAALYVLQACEAIAEAHGHGIVHRDLKPANLFLTSRANGTPCVKVLDFGISKEIDPTKKFGPTLTVTGTIMGSPAFMSPEQMLNGKSADTRTDIWALGAILFELTTGALPFHGENMTELIARVMNEPVALPSTLRPEIPGTFDTVVLACLQKKPARRFQSIEELMAALRPFVAEDKLQPVKAMPASSLPRIDDGPDSESSTRVVNPRPVKILPVASLSGMDDGPDSDKLTLVVKAVPQILERPRLPSAVDTDFSTTNEPTLEMPKQFHRPESAPLIPAHEAKRHHALSSSRRVLIGLGIFGAIAMVAFFATWTNDSPSTDMEVRVQNPAISAVPETTVRPMETVAVAAQPSTSSSAALPPKTGNLIKTPSTSAKSGRRTIKPTLF